MSHGLHFLPSIYGTDSRQVQGAKALLPQGLPTPFIRAASLTLRSGHRFSCYRLDSSNLIASFYQPTPYICFMLLLFRNTGSVSPNTWILLSLPMCASEATPHLWVLGSPTSCLSFSFSACSMQKSCTTQVLLLSYKALSRASAPLSASHSRFQGLGVPRVGNCWVGFLADLYSGSPIGFP